MSRRPNSPEGTCRDCNARIYWAEMPDGKKRPFDVDPSPRGSVVLFKRPDGTLRGQYVRKGERPPASARACHFDTCKAKQGRGRDRAVGAPAAAPAGRAGPGGAGDIVRVEVLVHRADGTVLRFPASLAEVSRVTSNNRRSA